MRVESDKPAKNGGWIHKGECQELLTRRPYRPEPKPKLPWSAMWSLWNRETTPDQIDDLAATLGVSPDSLERIGAVWARQHSAWAFPMRTAGGVIVGFRLRPLVGRKFAVKHSTNALFMPWPFNFPSVPVPVEPRGTHETGSNACGEAREGTKEQITGVCLAAATDSRGGRVLYITEGESDLAALLTVGLVGIGRPSCSSCVEMVSEFIGKHKVGRVVVIADNDEPGQQGAQRLQETLSVPSVVYTPPAKDIREAVAFGFNSQMMDAAIRDLEWQEPNK